MTRISLGDRRNRGLTLLEVLAAVMIFAMVMTVLIGTSTDAVHHVGTSARRLEADLVADFYLAGLEVQIKQGIAPVLDIDEFEEDPYVIRMTMTDLISGDPASGSPAGSGPLAGGDALSMLGGALPEVAGYLRKYDVEVSWLAQDGTQSVSRTTFAYDWQAAEIELVRLAQDASANSSLLADGSQGNDSETGDGRNGTTGSMGSGGANGGPVTDPQRRKFLSRYRKALRAGGGSGVSAKERQFNRSRNKGEWQRNSDALRDNFQNK